MAAFVVVVAGCVAGCAFERPPNIGQVAGTVSGMWTGSDPLRLRLRTADASEDLAVSASGAFAFATTITAGSYSVELVEQPAAHTCVMRSGSGEVGEVDVPVEVTCRGPGQLRLGYPHLLEIPINSAEPTVELSLLASEIQLAAEGPALTAASVAGRELGVAVYRPVATPGDDTAIEFVLTAGSMSHAGVLHVRRGAAAPASGTRYTGAAADEAFGTSVAASGDWLAVGAPGAGTGGEVRVYQRGFDSWMARGTLATANDVDDDFGVAVAMSGDVLAVGVPGDNAGEGAVELYYQSGIGWNKGPTLRSPDPMPGAGYGAAVALDRGRLIVGEPGRSGNNGAVYAYLRSPTAWPLVAMAAGALGKLGAHVAVRGDLAAVCAPVHGESQGALVRYEPDGSGWQVTGTLVGAFGESLCSGIALGGADPRMFVSAATSSGAGAVVVVRREGGALVREATLTSPNAAVNGSFGRGTAYDGEVLAIGAPGEGDGAVYLFRESVADGWVLAHQLAATGGAPGGTFGQAIAMPPGQVLVGAPGASSDAGATQLFQ